jgi:gamma-glutamylcyclotransferase (GGCT)/AIG2-like uncharacterized protein YtfP
MIAVTERLFVYGTLRRGAAPPALRELVEGWRWLGDAWVSGRLYDLGAFPGAVLDAAGAERVFGELAELPDEPGRWLRLDAYEGFDPERPEASLFRRVRCRAWRRDEVCEAWIYVCGRAPGPGRRIPGGRWTPPPRDTLGSPHSRRSR